MFKKSFLFLTITSTLMLAGCLINGKVVDQDGVGISGVTVILGGDASQITTTDGNGFYQFGSFTNLLAVDNYSVIPLSSGDSFSPTNRSITISNFNLGGNDVPWPAVDMDFEINYDSSAFSFTGTITSVLTDTGSGTYSGTVVGDSFSGIFVYGASAAQANDIHTESNERNWDFEGGQFGASISDGSTPTNFSVVGINIQNNWPLDADSVDFLNTLFGQNVTLGTPIDVFSSGGTTNGAFWIEDPTPGDPDNENLANGMILEVAFVSYNTALYSGLDYQLLPPCSSDLALFLIEEADISGNTLFEAVGVLDTNPIGCQSP